MEMSALAEHKHVQDLKEETEDFAIGEPPEGHGEGSPGAAAAGKRTRADVGPDADQSTSSKKARVSGEVSCSQKVSASRVATVITYFCSLSR